MSQDAPPDEQNRPTNDAEAPARPTMEAVLARVLIAAPAVHDEFMAAAVERRTAAEAFKLALEAPDERHAFRYAVMLAEQLPRVAVRWHRASQALAAAFDGRIIL